MGLIGENIKAIRKANGLTQDEFAALFNVSRSNIATYETTDTKPDAELADRISQYFDIPIADLFKVRLKFDKGKVGNKPNGQDLLKEAEDSAKNKKQARLQVIKNTDTRRPIYNVYGTASNIESFNDNPELVEGYNDIPELGDIEGYIRVFGNSMYPKYCNGDVVAITREITKRNIIPYGEVYFIITHEHRLIKYIDPDGDKSKVILRSEHPDFKPFEIDRNDILRLYAIKGKITRNLM